MAVLLAMIAMFSLQVDGSAGGSQAEELVKRITTEMEDVNRALREAADADAVSDQLDAARNAHLSVIRDIEKLIQQVKYRQNKNPQGGGGGQSNPSPSGEGGEQQPQPRPNDGSSAPEPEQQQPGDRPEQQASPDSEVPDEQAQPEGSQGGQQDARRPPPPDAIEPFTAQDTDARWGLLPPKMQERLLNLQMDDVPERYRAWLEAYIRALNRREQEGR